MLNVFKFFILQRIVLDRWQKKRKKVTETVSEDAFWVLLVYKKKLSHSLLELKLVEKGCKRSYKKYKMIPEILIDCILSLFF